MEGVRRVDVMGVRVEMPANKPILLLRERDGDRYVPVWVGAPEAAAIAYVEQGVVSERPLTHDLLLDVIRVLGDSLSQVEVEAMKDGVFYATLVLGSGRRVDSRTSDAVALAVREQCPIFVADAILDEVGVPVAVEEDDEVERFREFLDHVSADDFGLAEGDDDTEE